MPSVDPSSAYQRMLLAARQRGLAAGRAELQRISTSLAQSARDLDAIAARVGGNTATAERAASLAREIRAALTTLQARLSATGQQTLQLVISDVLDQQRAAATLVLTDAGVATAAGVAARYGGLNTRVLSALAARRGGTARTYQSLIARNLQDAIPALDTLLEAGIARGVSIDSLARSVRALLLEQTPEVVVDGLGGLSSIASDARRIARSETMNALREANAHGLLASRLIEGVTWQLSGAHAIDCECDELATEDVYDLGPGVWPVDRWPIAPHPNCGCYQGALVFRDESEWGRPQEATGDPEDATIGLPADWSERRRVAAVASLRAATGVRLRAA